MFSSDLCFMTWSALYLDNHLRRESIEIFRRSRHINSEFSFVQF